MKPFAPISPISVCVFRYDTQFQYDLILNFIVFSISISRTCVFRYSTTKPKPRVIYQHSCTVSRTIDLQMHLIRSVYTFDHLYNSIVFTNNSIVFQSKIDKTT